MPVPPHVFALAAERLDYARCERAQGGGLRLVEYRSVELPPGSFTDGLLGGPLADPAAFREGLAGFVSSLPEPVKAASLVIPDAWLRLAIAEGGELPAAAAAREEVLRWKLKRLVPFRVEELRVQGAEIDLPAAADGGRMLLAFGLETLLAQLEAAFTAAGVQLGQISNVSLSLLGGLASVGDAMQGLVAVERDGAYSLVFARGSEPLLHRYKAAGRQLAGAARGPLVERDLKLTRSFLEEQLGTTALGRVVLAAPAEREPQWLDWLTAGLEREVEPLAARHLPVSGDLGGVPLSEIAPLLGAASRVVA